MKQHIVALVGVVLITSVGSESPGPIREPWNCEEGPNVSSGATTNLTISEVVAIATSTAKLKGVELKEYQTPSLCYSSKYAKWTAFFDGVAPAPGNHFSVWVHDQTRAAELMWGE